MVRLERERGGRVWSMRRCCVLSALAKVSCCSDAPLAPGCRGVRGSAVSMTACSPRLLRALFGVQMQQVLHGIPRVFRVSATFEAVAKMPRVVVKLRPSPLQALNRTVPQYEVVSFTIAWHPSSVFSWSLRFSSWHECRSTTFFKAWV